MLFKKAKKHDYCTRYLQRHLLLQSYEALYISIDIKFCGSNEFSNRHDPRKS